VPNPTPAPPDLKSLRDVIKILVAVIVWFVTTDANKALMAVVDYAKVAQHVPIWHLPFLPSVAILGGAIGLLQGVILAVKALVFFWVGPTFFTALIPILTAAAKFPTQFVSDIRRAWAVGRRDDPTDNSGSSATTGDDKNGGDKK
jgi:hypothetical protein